MGSPAVLDLTAYLQEIVDADGTVMSVGAGAPQEASYSYIMMMGSTYPTANLRPYLVVDYEYVPEPATMTLLVLGGLGVLCRRKRR